MKTKNELLKAGLEYAKRGWRIHPLNGKKPYLKNWPSRATLDAQLIRKWWKKWPTANIGILTGSQSRLLVIDVDNKNGISGSSSIDNLQNLHGQLPDTLTASSPHGLHFYFDVDGSDFRNSAGFLAPGVDTRANGGYIVAPPSRTLDGSYEWLNDLNPAQLPPDWQIQLEKPTGTSTTLISIGSRNNSIFHEAIRLRHVGMPKDEARSLLHEMNVKLVSPPLRLEEVDQCLDSAWRYPSGYLPNDLGNAQRFIEMYGDRVRYVVDLDQFIVWRRNAWEGDIQNLFCMRLMKRATRRIWLEARECNDSELQKALSRYALRASDTRILKASLESVKSEAGMGVRVQQLDANPFLLGVQNGVVDLRTGELRDAAMSDLVTRKAGCEFVATAECPLWLKFLNRAFRNRPEIVDYLQELVGYTLTGLTVEQILIFLLGMGANGKSVFCEVVKAMLGDYGRTIRTQALMSGLRGRGGPSEDEARLAGARMVSANETAEGMRFDEAAIKDLTGGDTITARFLHKNSFEFIPQFTLFIRGNFKPIFNGADGGMARRIKLVAFDEVIPQSERDPHLVTKLLEELPGILNWAIEGSIKWQAEGLHEPAAVTAATGAYLGEMNSLSSFISEYGSMRPRAEVRASTLRHKYERYCNERGLRPVSTKNAGQYLRSLGAAPVRRKVGNSLDRRWRGIALRNRPRSDA